jgi:hypothetical protein
MKREITKRQQPALTVDDRGFPVSTRLGRYSDIITAELAKQSAGEVVTIGDITKVQYGRQAREGSHTEQYVRNRLTKAVNMLLHAGIPAFPIYEASGFHKKIGIKVIAEYNEEDYALLTEYQNAAVNRGDLSRDKANLIQKTMEGLRPKQSDGE